MNGERTNVERADTAERCLFYYDELLGQYPSIDTVTDLLADLMHYCAQNTTELTFAECLYRATRHFATEEEAE